MSLWSWMSKGKSPPAKGSANYAGGLRDLSSFLNQGGNGAGAYANAWTDSRIELVRHFRNWVYVAIDCVATSVAEANVNVSLVKKGRGNDSEVERRLREHRLSKALTAIQAFEDLEPVGDGHPLVRLLQDPNEPDTSYDLWYETILFLLLTGSAYWWVPPNKAGLPAAAWVIPSHWVWPVLGKENRLVESYDIRPVEGNYLRINIPADEIIHLKKKNPVSKIDGFSPVTACSTWVDASESIERSRFFTFKNGAFPGLAVELDDRYLDPSDDMIARIEAKFLARYMGETKAGKPLFLPPGVKIHHLTPVPAEMGYMESAEQVRDMVLAAFKVPAAVAMINKEMTYGSVRGVYAAYCSFTVTPLLRWLGRSLTEKLAWRYDERLRIWWDDPTPADPEMVEKQIEVDAKLFAITPNEVRALRGRQPYAFGGDNPVFAPTSLVLPYGNGKAEYYEAPEGESPKEEEEEEKPSTPEDDDDE